MILKELTCKPVRFIRDYILYIFIRHLTALLDIGDKYYGRHAVATQQMTYTTTYSFVLEELYKNRRTIRKRKIRVGNVGVMIEFPGR